MSGVAVIRHLLANAAAVTAMVPATRIKAGVLPLNTPLPAISVTQISSVPYNFVNTNESLRMHTDRVQVTGLSQDYASLKALLQLALDACPNQRGTVNTFLVDSIEPAFAGPDLYDQTTNIHESSRDFIVRWLK
jgi:hypothetical protein